MGIRCAPKNNTSQRKNYDHAIHVLQQAYTLLEYKLQKSVESLFFFCLFDLILYVPSQMFQLNRDGSSWVEPVLR